MIDGTYKIVIEVLFSRKKGTVVLRTEGDDFFADIDAPFVGKQKMQGRAEGDKFTAKGSGKIAILGKVDYVMKGEVSGDDLYVDFKTNKGSLHLEGTRV